MSVFPVEVSVIHFVSAYVGFLVIVGKVCIRSSK